MISGVTVTVADADAPSKKPATRKELPVCRITMIIAQTAEIVKQKHGNSP